jgi:hypothetical protein
MEFITEVNTYLTARDGNRIGMNQIAVFSRSGFGKGLISEGIVEELHKHGILIINICDPKLEVEYGFAKFPAFEHYHLELLKKLGRKSEAKKVKLYHPFTFSIPKNYLPEINFYTIPLKSLAREEFSLLSESAWDSETIKLLINASTNISDSDGMYTYLHYIQSLVKGKKENRKTKPDWRNFGLESTAGTPKSVSDISNFFQPFKNDYFLSPKNSPYNLNWKEILSDQESYHVFFYKWIKDEKMQEFIVLHLLQEIIRNKDLAKCPICIVIPEIRKLCPYYAEGYKSFLSKYIRDALSTCRSMGKGISTITDSQNWSDVSEEVKNSATVTLFGELSPGDAERVSKAMNYKRDIRSQLTKSEYGRCNFLVAGKEDQGSIFFPPPKHAHKEEHLKFEEVYHKYSILDPINYPEKRYTEMIKEMEKNYDDEEKKIKKLVKQKIDEEQQQLDKILQEKENKSIKTKVIEEKSNKIELLKEEKRQEKIKRVVTYWKEHSEVSWNKIGKECEVDPKMAKRYFLEWQESENKKIVKVKTIDNQNVNEAKEIPAEFIGDGILPEEVETNIDKEALDEMNIEGR